MKNLYPVTICTYTRKESGGVVVKFENHLTGETFEKEYRTMPIAQAQVSKFQSKAMKAI